jgi:hypothetical protein
MHLSVILEGYLPATASGDASFEQRETIMAMTFRAFMLTAALVVGVPTLVLAQPANTGNASEATGNPRAQPEQTTVPRQPQAGLPANRGGAAEAAGNPARAQTRTTRRVAQNRGTRVGNGASARGGYGTQPRNLRRPG